MSIFKSIGVALMTVIMAIFSAFAPPQDKPDSGSGNSGQTQQEVRITLDGAIDIAVADAGVARADARFTEAKLDADDRVPHYDIEFVAGEKEYDYEIAVSDGRILKKEVEPADPSKPSDPQPDVSGYIGIDEAKAIALRKVSLDESQVTFKKAKLDTDDRVPHYDIEFVYGGYEYEFEINAKTGAIIEFDRELEDKKPQVDTSNFITVEEAKAAALKRASLDESQVTFTKTKLDTDDRIPHYDIDFVSGGYEYEVEVNAKNGRIIGYEREREEKKPQVDTSKFISADAAKKAALAHAGLTEAQVTELEAELDTDSLTAHYDVEFKCGGYEYEYKINAKSGKVISFEKRETDKIKTADSSQRTRRAGSAVFYICFISRVDDRSSSRTLPRSPRNRRNSSRRNPRGR